MVFTLLFNSGLKDIALSLPLTGLSDFQRRRNSIWQATKVSMTAADQRVRRSIHGELQYDQSAHTKLEYDASQDDVSALILPRLNRYEVKV
jgi:hypothetical protein